MVMKNCFPPGSRSLLYNEVDEDSSVTCRIDLKGSALTATNSNALWLVEYTFISCEDS